MSSPHKIPPVRIVTVSSAHPLPEIDTNPVGLFGFQNAEQMDKFLRSENGSIIQTLIAEVVNMETLQKQQQELYVQDQQLKKLARSALLLFLFMREKTAHARLIEAITEQIEKRLQQKENPLFSEYNETVALYQEGLAHLQEIHAELAQKIQNIEKEQEALQQDKQHTQQQHELFDKALEGILSASVETLKEEHKELEQEIETLMKDIQILLSSGNHDTEARERIAQLNAKIARRAAMEERIHSYTYYDENGEITDPAKAPAAPQYALPKTLVLVRDSNELLLLPSNLLDQYKSGNLPEDDKKAAIQEFTRRKETLRSTYSTLVQKKDGELQALEQRQNELSSSAQHCRTLVHTLQSRTQEVQSALSQLLQLKTTPQPAKGEAPNKTNKTHAVINSQREMLKFLRMLQDNTLTPELKKALQQVPPGKPIPEKILKELMRLRVNFGSSVTDSKVEEYAPQTPLNTSFKKN